MLYMCHQVCVTTPVAVSVVHYQSGTVAPGVGEGETGEYEGIACPLVTKHWSKPEPVCVCVCVEGVCVHNTSCKTSICRYQFLH